MTRFKSPGLLTGYSHLYLATLPGLLMPEMRIKWALSACETECKSRFVAPPIIHLSRDPQFGTASGVIPSHLSCPSVHHRLHLPVSSLSFGAVSVSLNLSPVPLHASAVHQTCAHNKSLYPIRVRTRYPRNVYFSKENERASSESAGGIIRKRNVQCGWCDRHVSDRVSDRYTLVRI